AGMGCSLSTQRGVPRSPGYGEANSRSRALRFQLALGYGHRVLPFRDCRGIAVGSHSLASDENLLAHPAADAPGNARHFLHAWAWLRHTLFWPRRCAGPGLYAHRLALSVLWHISGLAWCRTHRQRYILKRAIRKSAADYFSAARNRSNSDVRR